MSPKWMTWASTRCSSREEVTSPLTQLLLRCSTTPSTRHITCCQITPLCSSMLIWRGRWARETRVATPRGFTPWWTPTYPCPNVTLPAAYLKESSTANIFTRLTTSLNWPATITFLKEPFTHENQVLWMKAWICSILITRLLWWRHLYTKEKTHLMFCRLGSIHMCQTWAVYRALTSSLGSSPWRECLKHPWLLQRYHLSSIKIYSSWSSKK